jgi:hypothetical protein
LKCMRRSTVNLDRESSEVQNSFGTRQEVKEREPFLDPGGAEQGIWEIYKPAPKRGRHRKVGRIERRTFLGGGSA